MRALAIRSFGVVRATTWLAAALSSLGSCSPPSPEPMPWPDGAPFPPLCADGAIRCEGDTLYICQDGAFARAAECAVACAAGFGCVECVPGEGACDGDASRVCRFDGSGFDEEVCDSALGVTCSPEDGRCRGACSSASLGTSYLGCEYYPTVTGNGVSGDFSFAVAVSNAGTETAHITVDGGALDGEALTRDVAAGGVEILALPWVEALKGCLDLGQRCSGPASANVLANKGAYRLRSTQPVSVYQFSALEYVLPDGQYSWTNDASLLIPANAMGREHMVASWPMWDSHLGDWPGLMAVTAVRDGTRVTITSTAHVPEGGAAAFPIGSPRTVALDRGDVIELFAYYGDLTGTTVTSNAPVQVIGGHFCTEIPFGWTACDHLEEVMFPIEALGRRYVLTPAATPALPDGRRRVVRIIATEANTTLAYEPEQPWPSLLADRGDMLEVELDGDVIVEGSHKILVAQYMEGLEIGGGSGDPAMTIEVPAAQYRSSYIFHAPPSYDYNYVNIVAARGVTVTLDGRAIDAAFTPVGTDFDVIKLEIGGGTHTIGASMPFGITVYGYGMWTSYWYPGGLDLDPILI